MFGLATTIACGLHQQVCHAWNDSRDGHQQTQIVHVVVIHKGCLVGARP